MGSSISNYNYGEQNAQFGANSNITVNKSQGSGDTAAALRESTTRRRDLAGLSGSLRAVVR